MFFIGKFRAAKSSQKILKHYFSENVEFLPPKWPLCFPKLFSRSSSSVFVPESETLIRGSIGRQITETQANLVANLSTDLPAECSRVLPSARGASVVSPLGLLCAITIGEVGSKLSLSLKIPDSIQIEA